MSPGKDQDRLLEHDYDGIQEYDNPMPRWWLWILIGTVVWSVLYFINIPGVGSGKGWLANYESDMAAARERYGAAEAAAVATMDDATVFAAAHDPAVVAKGKEQFDTVCSPCHLADGGGSIGPNLTDDFWIHGNRPSQIYGTVSNGVLDKGMPAWSQTMTPDVVKAVSAYVITLHGRTPAVAKEAQGEKLGTWSPSEENESETETDDGK